MPELTAPTTAAAADHRTGEVCRRCSWWPSCWLVSALCLIAVLWPLPRELCRGPGSPSSRRFSSPWRLAARQLVRGGARRRLHRRQCRSPSSRSPVPPPAHPPSFPPDHSSHQGNETLSA
ncbi:hypothetical protein QJS66_09115 [Kocuria rhizophila]|nr:hypothetical protein QJS66_09115 [Kocuria rhizophila]